MHDPSDRYPGSAPSDVVSASLASSLELVG
jgi:hypothetical protein